MLHFFNRISNQKKTVLTSEVCNILEFEIISAAKGQLISKGLFGILEFLQKTNKQIHF